MLDLELGTDVAGGNAADVIIAVYISTIYMSADWKKFFDFEYTKKLNIVKINKILICKL